MVSPRVFPGQVACFSPATKGGQILCEIREIGQAARHARKQRHGG
jgi:hypothetical protein